MSKKKNLERAIVLGLILSTGICGSAWAKTIEDFKNTADNNSNIVVKADTTVDGTGYYGPDVSPDSGPGGQAYILKNSLFERRGGEIVNLTVTAGNVELNFNNVNMLSPHIIRAEGTDGADIKITNTDTVNGNVNFAGINVSAIIEGNSLTIESMGRGIYTGAGDNAYPVKDADGNNFRGVRIDVNNQLKITSASDGIHNEGERARNEADGISNVNITAGGVYIENAERNGVYNAAGNTGDVGGNVSITTTAIATDADPTIGNIIIKNNSTDSTRDDLASVKNTTKGKTELTAYGGSIDLTSTKRGVLATKGEVSLNSGIGNYIHAVSEEISDKGEFGKGHGIHAERSADVNLNAALENEVYGAVYASGEGTKVDMKKSAYQTSRNTPAEVSNKVHSSAVIEGAGDLNDSRNVISSLYAQDGATITLTGINDIRTYADSSVHSDLERTVWAYNGSTIDINGATTISTDSYDKSVNSIDIAVVAGTSTTLTGGNGTSTVNVNYQNHANGNKSIIEGDILSAYAGVVNITKQDNITRSASNSGIVINGNLLAGNGGAMTVELGNGTLTGRVDDYGDAGLNTGHGAVEGENSFFNPAFSSKIENGGNITLIMDKDAVWNVTGQSWITNLKTTANAEDTLIDIATTKAQGLNSNASALTIGSLTGNTTFRMNLDGDRSASDMLYIKKAVGDENNSTAHYDIQLQNSVTNDEINSDGTNSFNGLRFATVGVGSNVDFTVTSRDDGGAFNVEYEVGSDKYLESDENTAYNSTSSNGAANVEKPGNASVDNFFGVDGTSTQKASEDNIMLMAETDAADSSDENTILNEVTNFKIVKRLGQELNDTGETILNMSRANYSNAIYMDRLNKRLGEARYINGEEDEGMWVRIRHDRIGKTDAYRSQNTMYELGYDQKQECDNGERRVGFAIDYMHGDTGYTDIAGKGEIDRYGLWLYDTWMGDKGHYVDYVAKWGHLSNDFEVYTMTGNQKVTGDYSNNVFSVSAEYGRKKDMGNDWYFEPQAQLQLARVTGADYTTNRDTKVSVDGINSLIGRAGFRIGKDFGEEKQSTLYFKADVLHEFLGDQDVYVMDKSSDNRWAGINYENEGTWYDVGIGFATQMSKNSYAFMDFEKSFGNDNDETYQINVGMQWSF